MESSKIKEILETPFWIPEISTDVGYERLEDDSPYAEGHRIRIDFSCDGDAWVNTYCAPMSSLRYRMPMMGGGRSPRTRQALLILAYAIMLDNEDQPLG